MMLRILACLVLSAVVVLGTPVPLDPAIYGEGVGSIIFGKCPNFTTQTNFDLVAYTGRWFEIQKFPAIYEIDSKCITADYSQLTEDSIKVVNSGQRDSDGTPYNIVGNATATDVSGRFEVYFENVPAPGSYNVLHTDYHQYTTIYSCSSVGPVSIQYAWILSRNTTLPDDLVDEAYKVFESFGINTAKLTKTVQDDTCNYQ